MHLIIELLAEAVVLLIAAYIMPQVEIKNFGKAFLVAILIGILNATIGWVLRGVFNLFTFWLLAFFVRLFVTAIVIKIVDKLMPSFRVHGFLAAVVLAIILALTGTALDHLFVQ